jgi:hypothetical protein
MRGNELSALLQALDAELTRIERKQARGLSVVHELQALVTMWADLKARAAGEGYVDAPHAERLCWFQAQAQAAQPWGT